MRPKTHVAFSFPEMLVVLILTFVIFGWMAPAAMDKFGIPVSSAVAYSAPDPDPVAPSALPVATPRPDSPRPSTPREMELVYRTDDSTVPMSHIGTTLTPAYRSTYKAREIH